MSLKAPTWANSSTCYKCKAVFGMFNRQHHCRACGQSFCQKDSQYVMPLPHFGMNEPVRVCLKCHSENTAALSSSNRPAPKPVPHQNSQRNNNNSNNNDNNNNNNSNQPPSTKKVKKCTCNMPLCVCPDEEEEVIVSTKKQTNNKPKPKHKSNRSQHASVGQTTNSFFSGFAPSNNKKSYNLKGNLDEQCRNAIKDGDYDGVVQLLEAKANADYRDRTGNSLLHLAAMFNRQDMCELLVKKGADMKLKNPGNETPLDLAPPSLAHKLKNMKI